MEENKPDYKGLENNLEQEDHPTEENLRTRKNKWKKFHKSLPYKMVLRGECFTLTLYRDEKGIYTPNKPERKKRWYWPF